MHLDELKKEARELQADMDHSQPADWRTARIERMLLLIVAAMTDTTLRTEKATPDLCPEDECRWCAAPAVENGLCQRHLDAGNSGTVGPG